MEELITLLLHLVQKVPYLSEVEQDGEMDLLRAVQEKLGVDGVVPPKAGPTNAPLAEPPAAPEVPGPVAERASERAIAAAAPFAQSTTILRPVSVSSGTASSKEATYSLPYSSLSSSAGTFSSAGAVAESACLKITSSIASSV